jgi:hypothetical protein
MPRAGRIAHGREVSGVSTADYNQNSQQNEVFGRVRFATGNWWQLGVVLPVRD